MIILFENQNYRRDLNTRHHGPLIKLHFHMCHDPLRGLEPKCRTFWPFLLSNWQIPIFAKYPSQDSSIGSIFMCMWIHPDAI